MPHATAQEPDPAASATRLPYGAIVEITPGARLIDGRPRHMETDTADIANAVMYKAGSAVVVIDNGATAGHRIHLDTAADPFRPLDAAVLVVTHGHADHTGNNGWIDTLGMPARAYMSDHDLRTMRDQVATFAPLFDAIPPLHAGASRGPRVRGAGGRPVRRAGP